MKGKGGKVGGYGPWASFMGDWGGFSPWDYMAMCGPYGKGAPSSRSAGLGMGKGPAMKGGGKALSAGSEEKDKLVDKIKDIQRGSEEGKQQWWQYCDSAKTGSRDPARQPLDFLKKFLQAYLRGETPQAPQRPVPTKVLRLRGLPFSCQASDIVTLFDEYEIGEEEVIMLTSPFGKPTGEAYVRFWSPEAAEDALETKQNKEIGSRYIEVFRSSEEELQSQCGTPEVAPAPKAARATAGGKGPPPSRSNPLAKPGPRFTVRLRGLPFASQASDVVEFLAEYDTVPSQVRMATGVDGRPTGEAFVVFTDGEIAERCLEEKHNQVMGKRYIEVFKATLEEWEMQEEVAIPSAIPPVAWGAAVPWDTFGDFSPAQWPPRKDIRASPYGTKGAQGWGEGGLGSGLSSGVAGSRSREAEKDRLVEKVKLIQRSGDEEKQKWWNFCEASGLTVYDPIRHGVDFLKEFVERYERGDVDRATGASRGSKTSASDGRTLRLRGLPFSCTEGDVVEFLTEYGVDEAQVAMGRGSDGRPTGEAFVIFPDKECADNALESKQKKEIGSRYIELFPSTYEEWAQASSQTDLLAVATGRGLAGRPASIPAAPLGRQHLVAKVGGPRRN
mmetsp:Transcript_40212/g.87902  ORF Transcript_40212/g.87902 Transcript_40212/m.87902 type:complete len:614 (+) Transcript_40212:81-1922(+)